MTHHIDLDTIVLRHGSHTSRDSGVCLMEAAAWWAHEDHTDSPQCVCPTLAAFGRSWNDGMRSDTERAQLKPYVPVLAGTAGTDKDAERRAWLALDWSVRVSTPAWLDLAGLADHAERLRGLPEQTGPDDEALAVLRDARSASAAAGAAAGAAAWAAAWAAARAAAWAAAWDAGDAAWAAGAAAWAAAGAAARAAARAALEPTVAELQASAHLLLRRMIAAGPHDPVALAALPDVTADRKANP